MKICNKEKVVKPSGHPEIVVGNIYKYLGRKGMSNPIFAGDIYICNAGSYLVSLMNGNYWSSETTFGGSDTLWEDVTNKYCLQEI